MHGNDYALRGGSFGGGGRDGRGGGFTGGGFSGGGRGSAGLSGGGVAVSSKIEDEDSGVDPEEGSDEISLSCLVSSNKKSDAFCYVN